MDARSQDKSFFKNIIVGVLLTCIALASLNIWVVIQYGFSNEVALRDALITLQFWFLGGLVIANTIRHYFPRQSRIPFFMGLIGINTAIWVGLSYLVIHFVQRKVPGYMNFLDLSIPVRVAFTLLLFTAVSMVFAFINTLQDQRTAELRFAESEHLARQTELNNLQEKLHPHFLFNSLNSINALVAKQPELARQMVQQLSDFLRASIKRDSQTWVPLEQELAYLSLYLQIEKVRFGHRLITSVDADEEALACNIPPFILLPIMENAIKFGLYDTLEEVTIKLVAKRTENMLTIDIANPFDPATAGQYKGTGFGLKSVNRRLYLLFGSSSLLKTSTEDYIFTTTVLIPQSA